MKAVIVEDEAIAARRLAKLLKTNGIEIISFLDSVESCTSYFANKVEADLIFMDIHLNDGIAFEIFDKVEIKIPIIFTTAYDQYAIKAFKQNSVDYLLKPINPEELKNAVEKFKEQRLLKSEINIQNLEQLLLRKNLSNEYKTRMTVKIGDRLRSISIDNIVFFYSEEKTNFIKTEENRSYPIDSSLDDILKSLNPKSFFKVNRSHIINIEFLADIVSFTNSRLKIKMKGNHSNDIIVARDRVKDFKEWLG